MDYSLKNIDEELWVKIKIYTAKNKISIKELILSTLEEKLKGVTYECQKDSHINT